MKQFKLRGSLLIVLCLLISCTQKAVQIDIVSIRLDQFLDKVRKSQQTIMSVKGLANVRVNSRGDNVSFKQVTIAEEPDLLRLEALAPFGRTAGIVSSDGEKIYVLLPEQTAVYDNPDDFDLSYVYPDLPSQISVSNLVNLLLGRLPQESPFKGNLVNMGSDSNLLVLTFFDSEGKETVIWVDPSRHRIERAKITLEDGKSAECRFGNFKEVEKGVAFPREIELKTGEFSISLIYEADVEVNTDIEKNLFKPMPELAQFEKEF